MLKKTLCKLFLNLDKVGKDRKEISDGKMSAEFIKLCTGIKAPRVLELGTKRSIPDRTTKHAFWVPHAGEYLGSDIDEGEDVDIVADVHSLSKIVGEEQFDIIISCSTFEHFKYPHLAAHEIMKVLKIDGLLYIQTHQSFHLHAYPNDYFRYSKEGLAGLFGTKMGFKVIETGYDFPARIYSKQLLNKLKKPTFLNVNLYGKKISTTPNDYLYEFESET
jgi:SAM-dependent methyltransferase